MADTERALALLQPQSRTDTPQTWYRKAVAGRYILLAYEVRYATTSPFNMQMDMWRLELEGKESVGDGGAKRAKEALYLFFH